MRGYTMITNKLTSHEMQTIMHNKSIKHCTNDERAQVMAYAFGASYMASDAKGTKQTYSKGVK